MASFYKRLFVVFVLTAAVLGASGCFSLRKHPAPPAGEVKTAPALNAAVDNRQSKASAAVFAATEANTHNTDSPAKQATAGELSVASANLDAPTDKDRAEALNRANLALKGDLKTAEEKWAKARDDAATLTSQVETLKETVKNERIEAKKELDRQLAAARKEAKDAADAQQRKIAAYIFYGGAFLLGVAGAVTLGLAGSVPIFGPKLSISLGIAAAASATLGALVNELLSNPWILRSLAAVLIAGVAAAIGLAISNHHHSQAPVTK